MDRLLGRCVDCLWRMVQRNDSVGLIFKKEEICSRRKTNGVVEATRNSGDGRDLNKLLPSTAPKFRLESPAANPCWSYWAVSLLLLLTVHPKTEIH